MSDQNQNNHYTGENGFDDSIIRKIHLVIDHYKKNFALVNKQERYKWEAIGWYKNHWNINAEDFPKMLATAFSKAGNLLASGMYYPYRMITGFAEDDPEEVRRIFKVLHDESLSLEERYRIFQQSCKVHVNQLSQEKGKVFQHYQDIRAVMVYLTFQYPEKYYLFKSTMFSDFRSRVGFEDPRPKKVSPLWKVESFTRLCEIILNEVQQDNQLIQMSKERLDSNCHADGTLHLLTMDLVYYGSKYMSEDDFKTVPTAGSTYWPTLAQYNPGISKEMWMTVLHDSSVTTPENLDMLKKMLELGGESTCARLADTFGNTHSYYNKLGSSYGEKVKKKYHCPDCPAQEGDTAERNRVYVIPFVGRSVMEDGNKRYSWKLRDELKEALLELVESNPQEVEEPMTDIGLNTILYGPPGTGKTYHTVIYAVAIIENKKLAAVESEDYATVLERYNAYKSQGLIEFTTFHQSYGYEEFIEGIKPDPEETNSSGNITYRVQPGIFRKFCEQAAGPAPTVVSDYGTNSTPTVWKISLAGAGENPIRTECMENGHIRIGWDEYGPDTTDEMVYSGGGKTVLSAFINRMQVGDFVLSCFSASTIDAVGVVTGEYEWHDEHAQMKRQRAVKWIVKGIRENILEINGGTAMTLSSVYRMNISPADVFKIIEEYKPSTNSQIKPQNYVFIIDEINRGNISKIFGELITLIESSKRIGFPEGMTARLPYSMQLFGVPNNVYIIGTMNTADRSIATIDTALRRRFLFREMLPNPTVLEGITVEDLSVAELLTRINQRITVLYDREHTIGHAYFMVLKDSPTIEILAEIFKNNIIPLLQEYFYEDYEKIRLVLGDNQKDNSEYEFILKHPNNYASLFGNADVDLDEGFSYEINYKALEEIEAYRSI